MSKENLEPKRVDQSALRSIQFRMLDTMVLFDEICRKEKLTYYLFGGSLLGAVRHKGFIPWDDDADVAMPRRDFEKLKKVIEKYLPQHLEIQTYETDPACHGTILYIRDMETACELWHEKVYAESRFNGTSLDVFPLDNARREHSITNWWRAFWKESLETFAMRAGTHNRGDKMFKQRMANWIAKLHTRKQWCVLRDKVIMGRYGEEEPYYINLGSHYNYKNQVFLKEKLNAPVQMEFEGHLFYVPKDADYVLRKFYGDNYMQPPSQEERQGHFAEIKIGDKNNE